MPNSSLPKYIFLIFFVVIGFYSLWVYFFPQPPAFQVFYNGKILTFDQSNQVAQALAVKRNKIYAVGSNEEIKALALAQGSVVEHDLAGRTLMPGFIDAHGHFPGEGLSAVLLDLNSPPIGKVATVEDALILLEEKVGNTKKGEWVFAFGFDDTLLKEKRHLTRKELDNLSTDHPIFVMHISGHMGVANSPALAWAGFSEEYQMQSGEMVGRDEDGKLNGFLAEKAIYSYQELLSAIPLPDQISVLFSARDKYLSQGVTTAQNGLANEPLFLPLALLSKLDLLKLRLVMFPDEKLAKKIVEGTVNYDFWENERFVVGPVKIVADGSIQGYTGYLSQPYHVTLDEHPVAYRGFPIHTQEELDKLVVYFHQQNWQMAIHGNGDAAIDMIIAAFEKAQAKHLVDDPRLILIHSQMARPDQLDQMKRLGISPSFFTAHVYYWGDRHQQFFIGERANQISPMKTAIEKGLLVTHHLDSPIVPMSPLFSTWVATNRETRSGRVLGQAEKISTIQALRATTLESARQVFLEESLGSLEKGKLADFIVLSEDPLLAESGVKDIKVLKTFLGGTLVYESDHQESSRGTF